MHIMAKSSPGASRLSRRRILACGRKYHNVDTLCVPMGFTVGVLLLIIEGRFDHRGWCR